MSEIVSCLFAIPKIDSVATDVLIPLGIALIPCIPLINFMGYALNKIDRYDTIKGRTNKRFYEIRGLKVPRRRGEMNE